MDAIPMGPFKTIHLLVAMPAQEAALAAAISDYNRGFAQDGCPTCGYHLFKLAAGNNSKYTFAMIGEWPGRDAYAKVHASPTFAATSKRDPIIADLGATEIYGRYVEVK
jgi:quinol monooxygenase YgiN